MENPAITSRERWIIYPLLFLALGAALRDKLNLPTHIGDLATQIRAGEIAAPRVRCTQLVCEQLVVNGPEGRPVVVAGANAETKAGIIETLAADGSPQTRLFSTDTGGMVSAIGHGGKVVLVMGHAGQDFGVFAQSPEQGTLLPLVLPGRIEIKPNPAQVPKVPPANKPTPPKTPSESKPAETKDGAKTP